MSLIHQILLISVCGFAFTQAPFTEHEAFADSRGLATSPSQTFDPDALFEKSPWLDGKEVIIKTMPLEKKQERAGAVTMCQHPLLHTHACDAEADSGSGAAMQLISDDMAIKLDSY